MTSAPGQLPGHGIATAFTANQPPSSLRDRPCDPTIQALKRSFQLEVRPGGSGVRTDDWPQAAPRAPLASPEALSETSSLASFGSGSIRRQSSGAGVGGSVVGGHRRLALNQAMRMDPIRQSPLCRSSTPPPARLERAASLRNATEGCCRRLDVGDERACSLTPCPQVQSDASSLASTQDCPASATVQPSQFPVCQTVAEIHHNVDSPMDAVELIPLQVPSRDSLSNFPDRLSLRTIGPGLEPLPAACSCDVTSAVGSDDGCQYLYDPYIGHYSQAGRGYPHGFNACSSHTDVRRSTYFAKTEQCADPTLSFSSRDGGCGSNHVTVTGGCNDDHQSLTMTTATTFGKADESYSCDVGAQTETAAAELDCCTSTDDVQPLLLNCRDSKNRIALDVDRPASVEGN